MEPVTTAAAITLYLAKQAGKLIEGRAGTKINTYVDGILKKPTIDKAFEQAFREIAPENKTIKKNFLNKLLTAPEVIAVLENTQRGALPQKQLYIDIFTEILPAGDPEDTADKFILALYKGLSKDQEFVDLVIFHSANKLDEIHDAIVPKKIDVPTGTSPNIVLFNNYVSKNEDFYLERGIDSEFNDSLKISNIWVFGKSGAGKTALIIRNLIQNEIEYCYCDLSPLTISTPEDVLSDILSNVENKFDIKRNVEEKNIIKQITKILGKKSSNKTVIVIDELSVIDETLLKNIANTFVKLVNYFSNIFGQDELKFVVSTIPNPSKIVQDKSKAGGYFQYICCDYWDDYSPQLFDILCKALNVRLEEEKPLIIKSSKHSPRILKSILRKIVIFNDCSTKSVEKAIKMTQEEIVE